MPVRPVPVRICWIQAATVRAGIPDAWVRFWGGDGAQARTCVRGAGGVPPDPARLHQRALARAGDADDRVDAVPAGQQPGHRRPLLFGQLEADRHLEDVDGGRRLLAPSSS
ncbi:hypothetical protein STHAL_07005 [Streptomyces halstedii]|uniref:Uncharacterized protein n=1 Tax=Streptomyces halstedii TaxID=1944 RepID=A0ABS6TM84_STRHA|nr:hypothetical protein [Streptomyces halstedii]